MTPLAKKLLMKPGAVWLHYHAPKGYGALLEPLPAGVSCATRLSGEFDGIQLFVRSKAELSAALKVIVPLLKPETIFWVSYPKKSSGIVSDLKMEDWDELYALGLQGVASLSVDATWAGSRFRPRGQAKASGTGKAEIRNGEFAAFIDVDRKVVTPPPDMQRMLEQHGRAMDFFGGLSYSNKKEYVLWILTAKQEKTRGERLVKLVEKLVAGKKNPAEK